MGKKDLTEEIAYAIFSLTNAITPRRAAGNHDDTGCYVESLTEAVMGMTKGLVQIAEAINNLAEATEGTRNGIVLQEIASAIQNLEGAVLNAGESDV